MISQEGSFFWDSMQNDTNGGYFMTLDEKISDGSMQPLETEELCPMPDIAQLIGGKWKLIVLQILIFKGTKRFNELRRMVEGITQTMLTNQLRALERDGLVTRKVYAEVPPRVEYSATPRAVALTDMFHAMHTWWTDGQ